MKQPGFRVQSGAATVVGDFHLPELPQRLEHPDLGRPHVAGGEHPQTAPALHQGL